MIDCPDGYVVLYNELDGELLISIEALEAMDRESEESYIKMKELEDLDRDDWIFAEDD